MTAGTTGVRGLARRVGDRLLRREGPIERQWCRLVMNRQIDQVMISLSPDQCSAVEISGSYHANRPWKSYDTLRFPEFDICSSEPDQQFDVVICEQVLEHVRDPWLASKTLRRLCRPGGHVIVSTPFLIKIHNEPTDYWRFTGPGLRLLLESAGLEVTVVATWGNRRCAQATLHNWVEHRRWRSLRNEESLPLVVWAVARSPGTPAS